MKRAHLLNKLGPDVLLQLPVGMKIGTDNVAVEVQLLQAEPEDAAGFLTSIGGRMRSSAAIAE